MLSSSRRVKKGPGRRPLSDKRRRFMELRGRGWSIRAAAREVEVSRSSGTNWARGYSVYRAGQLVRTVAPLDRLAVRAISARFLSEDERIQVADLRRERLSIRQIATQLNRSPSTILRELRRNASASGTYRPHEAHRRPSLGGHAIVSGESIPLPNCSTPCRSCSDNGGVRSRSAAI